MAISLDPGTFKHLLPIERAIWGRFLPTIRPDAIKVDYDVHLGAGLPAPADALPGTIRQVAAITQKRVDAVVFFSEAIVIYEIKRRAGMSALGQLINYERLYVEEKHPALPVHLAVVCEAIEPDVMPSFVKHGVEVYIT